MGQVEEGQRNVVWLSKTGDSLIITVPAMPVGTCMLSVYRPINAASLGKTALCHLYLWTLDHSIARNIKNRSMG